MVDRDLVDEVSAAAARLGGISRLVADEANAYVERIAEAYIADKTFLRWWESLRTPCKRLKYSDGEGLSLLAGLVEGRNEVILVVTDDAEPPWPIFRGKMQDIVNMLEECRYFEYFIAAQDMSWIVFDTHMNELVVSGQLLV
jgi:hypothetical protein